MRNKDFLDVMNDLDQHLEQAKSVISYLGIDVAENRDFTASIDVVSGMLWTAQTLLENAQTTAEELTKIHRQECLKAKSEKPRLATGGKDD